MSFLLNFRRNIVVTTLLMSSAVVVASLDIYLPALPMMVDLFETTEYIMLASLMVTPFTAALLGLVFGYLSDLYGRRLTLMISLFIFMFGSFVCTLAGSIEIFFLGRFVQAIGGGGVTVLALAIVSDLFSGIEFARIMGIYGPIFPITWAISPLIGAQLLDRIGWQSTFMAILFVTLPITVILFIYLPETFNLNKRPLSSRKELLKKITKILKNSEFLVMSLGHSFPICTYIIFISNASFIYINTFKFSPVAYSVVQATPVVVNLIGYLFYQRSLKQFDMKGTLKLGLFGYGLYSCMAMTVLFRIAPNDPYILVLIFCLHTFITPFIISICAINAFEIFPEDRGLSVALVALVRNLIVTGMVMIVGLFFDGTIVPIFVSSVLIVFITVVMVTSNLKRKNV